MCNESLSMFNKLMSFNIVFEMRKQLVSTEMRFAGRCADNKQLYYEEIKS